MDIKKFKHFLSAPEWGLHLWQWRPWWSMIFLGSECLSPWLHGRLCCLLLGPLLCCCSYSLGRRGSCGYCAARGWDLWGQKMLQAVVRTMLRAMLCLAQRADRLTTRVATTSCRSADVVGWEDLADRTKDGSQRSVHDARWSWMHWHIINK